MEYTIIKITFLVTDVTHTWHLVVFRGKYFFVFVRGEGLEPSHPLGHQILSLARLPIPPSAQIPAKFRGFVRKVQSIFLNSL